MAAFGLYTHIRKNRVRSIVLIVGLFLLVYLMLFAIFLGYEGMKGGISLQAIMRRALNDTLRWWPVATGAAFLWVAVGYSFHQAIIDGITGARTIERADNPELYNLLENLCISRGITMPQLKLLDTDVLNAYASGMNEKQYAVTVTRGLIENLDRREIEAVLAHELTHIRNGDVQLMIMAVVIAGIISFLGEAAFRWFLRGPRIRVGDGDSGKKTSAAAAAVVIAAVLLAVAWLLSQVLRFALSRTREYLADAGAVELTKDPDAMISALVKISGRAELEGVPSGLMEMCIENERSGIVDLFATHPPIETRINALVQNAGGRLPDPEALKPLAPPAEPAWMPVDPARPQAGPWAR
jgi:heat shock protein HtpX